jgi:L-ascorbate metabolism protein UlaG (beta-lactamase superfamily)
VLVFGALLKRPLLLSPIANRSDGDILLSLTYLGHSAVLLEIDRAKIYIDPYILEPVELRKLPKADLVIFTHGHFDHGALMAGKLFEMWRCKFLGPRPLIAWMHRKYRKVIPRDAYSWINAGDTTEFKDITITAVPAYHPLNRLGRTLLRLFSRSSAPGKPVFGYYIDGYYHSGDTVYASVIPQALKGMNVHTACLPIGGKYATASPAEALKLAEEIGARRLVPLHWQPLLQQVHFRYQPSDLVRLAKTSASKIQICPLAIGEVLELADKATK